MNSFVYPFNRLAVYDDIKKNIAKPHNAVQITGCVASQKAHLIFGVCDSQMRLVVTHDEIRARMLTEEYRFFDKNVVYYPAKDFIFYSVDIHGNQVVKERISCIQRIARCKETGERLTVVTTIDGLMDKLLPIEYITNNCLNISSEDSVDLTELEKRLVKLGYDRVGQVEAGGEFAVRGGIIDIFPFTEENPVRIELWGDEIDSIRSFDVESQRSVEELKGIRIYPATEMLFGPDEMYAALKKIKADTQKAVDAFEKDKKLSEAARIQNAYKSLEDSIDLYARGSATSLNLDSYINYFAKDTVSFYEYFNEKNTIVVMDEPARIDDRLKAVQFEFTESMSHRLEKGNILGSQSDVIMSDKKLYAGLDSFRLMLLTVLDYKIGSVPVKAKFDVMAKGVNSYNNSFETLVSDIKKYRRDGYSVVIVSSSRTRAVRLSEDLKGCEINAYFSESCENELVPGEVMTTFGAFTKGFEYTSLKFVMIAESDIFTVGRKEKKKITTYTGKSINSFSELSIGDYVVHENYGLGIYRGIEKLEIDKVEKDYIKIEYGGGSNLYILATQLDVIQKYAGPDAKAPKLNKLGGKEWSNTKARVKKAVDGVAKQLVELYAARQAEQGYVFSPDSEWQREFEEMFPYEETKDQLIAIEDTKRDMESSKIMDRLICGDVGFGKTEIAIRAAFKAVQDSKQVAYLVPTTILAQQHYNSFLQRMQPYGVRVELLSRFATPSQVKKTLGDLKKGLVDVVVGTHRILSKDVEFKDLGLLIVDEEQRFGVTHKEKIKQLKKNVDVMTLSATPIPRTLHMSLVGIRDMSVLTEPPVDRMPIQTFVTEYDEELVREAIIRELSRHGQVYYVFNMVKGIEDVAARIAALVPDANVAFAHGQMPEHQLERIMLDFINGDIDILVSTTIIETGLDIPNTNTIIIHDAEKFGLSQLYQLRGRVGRSNRTAYAFLMYRRDKLLKEVAEKRLAAIKEYTELGSGFKIAMKDLEIRGAGNVLGEEQHGHMEAVGYDMYCKMLNEAVLELKGEKTEESFDTTLDIPIDALIPATYIKSEATKLDVYKRIATITTEDELSDMQDELTDRFGDIPHLALNLMEVALLKAKAHQNDITEIKGNSESVIIRLFPRAKIDVTKIPDFVAGYDRQMRFKPDTVPYFIYTPFKDELKGEKKYLETIGKLIDAVGTLRFA